MCAGFYIFVISPGYEFAIWDRTRGGGNKEWPAIYHGSRVGGVLNCRCVNAGGSAGITKQKKNMGKDCTRRSSIICICASDFQKNNNKKKTAKKQRKKKWKKEEEGIKLD